MTVSIIVPILNESAQLNDLLEHLRAYERSGCEIIFVDGGSRDQSFEQVQARGFSVFRSNKGRALQMNTGAQLATKNILLFLHADTRLPENADRIIEHALEDKRAQWGRFNVEITGQAFMFKIVAWFMNHRSRLSSIVTGDQAIFIRRDLFEKLGGFPVQALMEDIEFSKRLKSISKAIALRENVLTSGRRWEQKGIWRTIFLMWSLRYAYWRGASAEDLSSKYR